MGEHYFTVTVFQFVDFISVQYNNDSLEALVCIAVPVVSR